MMTLPSGPPALDQPRRLAVRLEITESQAASAGILERWQAARKRQSDRQVAKARRLAQQNNAARELQESILRLFHHAESEKWGRRKLAAQIGIPKTTLLRIRNQQVDPLIWLPKVRSALSRLTPA